MMIDMYELPLERLRELKEKAEVLEKELEAASKYIAENEVIHKKVKKVVPTVIEYRGRRYVLDHADHRK